MIIMNLFYSFHNLVSLFIFLNDVIRLASSGCTGPILASEYNALQALYESTNGEYWKFEPYPVDSIWKFPGSYSDPCTNKWQGLNCSSFITSSSSCTVNVITLASFNISGSLPSAIGNLTNVDIFDLNGNLLTGTVPTEISRLTKMRNLNLYRNQLRGDLNWIHTMLDLFALELYINHFTGTIPTIIGNMTGLFSVSLYENSLIGTIPSNIQLLQGLTALYLGPNSLTGPIPTEIGLLTNLGLLTLTGCSLSGHVPTTINNNIKLTSLSLSNNLLSGPIHFVVKNLSLVTELLINNNFFTQEIPSSISQLTSLGILSFNNNYFSKSLPTSVVLLNRSLEQIDVSVNLLTGTIPIDYAALVRLTVLDLGSNFLRGLIPTQLGELKDMTALVFSDNQLSGIIPISFGTLTRLQVLYFQSNFLTGTIPTELGKLVSLESFTLYDNLFTGTVPVVFDQFVKMQSLFLDQNLLSGSFPDVVLSLTTLLDLEISSNRLTGTVPIDLQSLGLLEALGVNENYFSGQITIDSLPQLAAFNISNNLLTGQLTSLFTNSSKFPSLAIFDASYNGFTGDLPNILFESEEISSILINNNCFQGSISEKICRGSSIEQLILTGLSSSTFCNVNLGSLDRVFTAEFPNHFMMGTIPECVWNMKKLQILYLSSNGLTGTLGKIPDSSALRAVVLSNNNLFGTIPPSLQMLELSQLDLSFNRFTGTISSSIVVSNNSQVILNVNRLSGPIPGSLWNADTLNVLEGNIFQCSELNLPPQDPAFKSYVCASNDFYDSLVVVFALIGVGLAIISVWMYRSSAEYSLFALSDTFQSIATLSAMPNTRGYVYSIHTLSIAVLSISALYVFVLMIVIVVLKEEYVVTGAATYQSQYGWTTTAAYMHGLGSTALLYCFLIVSVSIIWILRIMLSNYFLAPCPDIRSTTISIVERSHRSIISESSVRNVLTISKEGSGMNEDPVASSTSNSANPRDTTRTSTCLHQYCITFCAQLLNGVIVTGVNFTYVYAIFQGMPRDALALVQLALAIFKLVWSSMIGKAVTRISKISDSYKLFNQICITTVTFVTGPIIATVFTDSDCMLYAIIGITPVVDTVELPAFGCDTSCALESCITDCQYSGYLSPLYITSNIAWIYSYQCSSAIFTNYIPVLVLSFGLSAIVVPLLNLVALTSTVRTAITELFDHKTGSRIRDTLGIYPDVLPRDNQRVVPGGDELIDLEMRSIEKFNCSRWITKMCLSLVVLLTFGMASPLLAIVIALDSIIQARLLRIMVGHVLTRPSFVRGFSWLEILTANSFDGFNASLYVVVLTAAFFWSIPAFDMVGDLNGAIAGAIAACLVYTTCLLWYWGLCWLDRNPTRTMILDGLHWALGWGRSPQPNDIDFNSVDKSRPVISTDVTTCTAPHALNDVFL